MEQTKPKAKVQLYWLKREEGGRVAPLHWHGLKRGYHADAIFEDDGEMRMVNVYGNDEGTEFSLEFRRTDGPNKLLYPGSKFELKEGPKTVARGSVS